MYRPILFNTEMVQAILDGRKSVTRRLIKSKQYEGLIDMSAKDLVRRKQSLAMPYCTFTDKQIIESGFKKTYQVGDILWVRETWNKGHELDGNEEIIDGTEKYFYAAGPDNVLPNFTYWLNPNTGEHMDHMPWKPSIHMPKAAARIFLRVKDVRVGRLNDMSIQDMINEGISTNGIITTDGPIKYRVINRFEELWDSATKEEQHKFTSNPYVWAIEFERCEKPEDLNRR